MSMINNNDKDSVIKVASDDNKKFAEISYDLQKDMVDMWDIDVTMLFSKFFDHRQNMIQDGQYSFAMCNEMNSNNDIIGVSFKIARKVA